MSHSDKTSLEERLATLLGIDISDDRDYVTDVLNSLVDIGDADDVAEYLSGFVGDADSMEDKLQSFARDVKKFASGESISSSAEDAKPAAKPTASGESKPKAKVVLDEAAAQREEIRQRELKARERQRVEQELWAKKKEEEEEKRRKREAEEATAAAAEKKKKELLVQKNKARQAQAAAQKKANDAAAQQSKTTKKPVPTKREPKKQQKQPLKPKKGTPKSKCCGCYGNKHKPLTNCLHCGRISCEIEGINDYCHFCGNFIEDISSSQMTNTGDPKQNSAIRHKERLLEFDRTSAQRTHIHDDQEDYFVSSNSMWATQEEQVGAREMEEERRQKLHDRKKPVLNINF